MRGTRPGKAAIGGCKLPFESPSVGDGYAASGECVIRQMTPAERERYGEAKVNGKAPFVWRKKEDDTVSRLDIARDKLSKEKYLELKEAGMLDSEIVRKNFGVAWMDVLNILKKEWGLIGAFPNPGNTKKKEEIKQAVKVDIEKPAAEVTLISKSGEVLDTFPAGQRALTALDAADEFYTLQEDLDMLDEEISRLTKERIHTTDRMKALKAALEGVMVKI